MNDLIGANNNDDLFVYSINIKHNHHKGKNPLVIFKSTNKTNKTKQNIKKWYNLINQITFQIYENLISCDNISNWTFYYEYNDQPNGQDNGYMQEFLYEHYLYLYCYLYNNPLVNLHFKIFINDSIDSYELLKYDKDINIWEPIQITEFD